LKDSAKYVVVGSCYSYRKSVLHYTLPYLSWMFSASSSFRRSVSRYRDNLFRIFVIYMSLPPFLPSSDPLVYW